MMFLRFIDNSAGYVNIPCQIYLGNGLAAEVFFSVRISAIDVYIWRLMCFWKHLLPFFCGQDSLSRPLMQSPRLGFVELAPYANPAVYKIYPSHESGKVHGC